MGSSYGPPIGLGTGRGRVAAVTRPRTEQAHRLSPILAVTALLGSAAAFVYVVVAALAPLS